MRHIRITGVAYDPADTSWPVPIDDRGTCPSMFEAMIGFADDDCDDMVILITVALCFVGAEGHPHYPESADEAIDPDARLEARAMRVSIAAGGFGISTDTLREVSIPALIDRAIRDQLAPDDTNAPLPVAVGRRGRGRPPVYDLDDLERVAATYVAAGGGGRKGGGRAAVEELGHSRAAAYRLIRRARDAGLIETP